MKKLDEFEIIKIFQKNFGNKNFVSEDVESFRVGKTKIVINVDTLVQSTDIPSQMNLADAARKSVVACISDFAAKGIQPKFGMISVNLPSNISKKEIEQIAKGFKKASKEFKVKFLGGDTNQGKEIVFHVCLFGMTDKLIQRKGVNQGNVIFVTGPFGYTSSGLEILMKNMKGSQIFLKRAKKSVLRPIPRLEFCLKNKKYFTSSMDSSDGLSTTLIELAKQNNCRFVINNIPTKKDVIEFSQLNNLNLENLVFHGGEEYEIIFTVSKKNKSKIIKSASLSKIPIIEIGYVSKGKGVVIEKNNKFEVLRDLGWRHFNKK